MTIGPPWRKPVLVRHDLVLRQAVDLVEVIVGVEVRLLPVVIGAAVEPVGPRPGRELHLHRSWPGAGARHRAGDGDFLDRVEARRHHREEAVGRLQHVAGLHAVDGDVDGVVRQAVDAGGARAGAGTVLHAGQHVQRVERVARRQRHFVELLGDERRGHRRRLALHQLRTRADLDGLAQRTELHRGFDVCGSARDDPHVVDDGGLETLQRDGDRVGADGDAGHRERARFIRGEVELLAGRVVHHDDRRAWNHAPRGVHDHAGETLTCALRKARRARHEYRGRLPIAVAEHCVSCILLENEQGLAKLRDGARDGIYPHIRPCSSRNRAVGGRNLA